MHLHFMGPLSLQSVWKFKFTISMERNSLYFSKKLNLFILGEEKKKTCLASCLCGKRKEEALFFSFFKMAAGHIFQNNRPAYFFKMAARHT